MRHLNAWQWGILAILALNAVVSIAMIGKERKPTTPGVAIAVLVINAAMAYAVVMA